MEQIVSASGTQYGLLVNPDGSLNTVTSLSIGSININAGSEVWVQNTVFVTPSGIFEVNGSFEVGSEVYQGTNPWNVNINNNPVPISGIVNTGLYAGSENWIKNFNDLGSKVYQGTNPWVVNINNNPVPISGTIIGSVNATIGNLYIQSGDNLKILDTIPTDPHRNNPYYTFIYITSGTATGVTGSSIGSIIQYIGTGSYVQVLTYSNDLVINIGSWV